MLRSARGIVHAWEGCVVLDIEAPPPGTLVEAIALGDQARGLSKILLETGINTGPVDVEFEVLAGEPAELAGPVDQADLNAATTTSADWEDVWEDLDLLLPPGTAVLHGPGPDEGPGRHRSGRAVLGAGLATRIDPWRAGAVTSVRHNFAAPGLVFGLRTLSRRLLLSPETMRMRPSVVKTAVRIRPTPPRNSLLLS